MTKNEHSNGRACTGRYCANEHMEPSGDMTNERLCNFKGVLDLREDGGAYGQPDHINGNAKASVFEDLFSFKENLFELYRVLHPEDKVSTIEDLKHVTLKNIVTRGRYNDLGFMVGNRLLILVEAQSTWSVNILPRCIIYLGETWNRYFVDEELNIYGKVPIELPEPELYVIYTGKENITKRYIRLSEEFFKGKRASVEAEIKVIQYSGGSDIIDQYIEFCKIFDEQCKKYPNDKMLAVKETIRICIERDILKKYLEERMAEIMNIMSTLYDQEYATKIMLLHERRDAMAEGEARGVITLLKRQGASLQDAVAALQDMLSMDEKTAAETARKYW